MNSNRVNFLINIAYYATVILCCYVVIKFGIPCFWPFLGGLMLAFIFKRISRVANVNSKISMATIGIAFYAVVVLIFWILFVLLAGWLVNVAAWFPELYRETLLPVINLLFNSLANLLIQLNIGDSSTISLLGLINNTISQFVARFSTTLISTISSFITSMPMFLVGFIFMIVSSFAILMDYQRVVNFLVKQVPSKFRPLIFDIKDFLESCLFKIIKSYAIIIMITFSELCLGLWALRVEKFWHIAAIIAVLDILPILGSGTILIPWALFTLLSQNYILGMGLLIVYAIITIIRNIIEPKIVGTQLGLHPVVTLATMFFGLSMFGLPGMILSLITVLLFQFLNKSGKIKIFKPDNVS